MASSATGHVGGFRKDERQRPRPERRGERRCGIGIETHQRLRRLHFGHVGDQRIEGRPAFGLVEPRDRLAIGRVRAEPINRFGRECDQAAGGKDACRLGGRCRSGLCNACRKECRHRFA